MLVSDATKKPASDVQERIDGAVEQFVEEHSVDNVFAEDKPKAKKKCKSRSKKQEIVAE